MIINSFLVNAKCKRSKQEIIFPVAFVDIICEVAVKWHSLYLLQ